ncbi:MAG: DHHA1 domain-containing protein [Candidatus Promineifilaceae bacterium]|nr:DHHA1 domain-containing protein [Candidatus Promineifilaceae bacterium]
MSDKLYYHDAYQRTFTADVIQRFSHEGRPAVILDQTCFYPTSGGQPADRGKLNERDVIDVFFRESDGEIAHVLSGELWDDEVTGEIDWARRFDHMQQHTGQHVLSQAFIKVAGAETMSFHLSAESVTIDLKPAGLQPGEIERAEMLSNEIIWEDRPIQIHVVSESEAHELPLRKVPDLESDSLRLVEIEGFDLTACGGTHVARTGAIGLIKIVKLERRGEELRVYFSCGRRALLDYRQKNGIVNRLSNTLTTGYWNLEEHVDKLLEENKETQRQLRRQQAKLLRYEAAELVRETPFEKQARIVSRCFLNRDRDELHGLAKALVEHEGTVALLGIAGNKAHLLFARAEDAPGQMNQLLKSALQTLDNGGGGGTATFAQGGGPPADESRIQQALNRAKKLLLAQL